MKKLLMLFLVLTGYVCSVSADKTVYLIPDVWDDPNATEYYVLYMFDGGNKESKFALFTDSGLGFWTATLEDGYNKIILIRRGDSTLSFDNKWNQSQDITFNASTPLFKFPWSDNWNWCEAYSLYKLYVKNMESDANVNFDSWDRGNNYFTWPGQALDTETIESVEWNVFYWPLSTINGTFTLDDSENAHHVSGGQAFDLSSVKYYYYYPSLNEHVDKDDALAQATTIHFRIDAPNSDFDTSKFYFWNNAGLNGSYCFSDQTIDGYKWKTITTHKPSFNIQFYTGDGGNSDNTKTDNDDVTCISGEEAFYVYRTGWRGNSKSESSYYVVSTDNAGGGNTFLAGIQMESVGNFVYKAILDNATTTQTHFMEVAPASLVDASIHPTDYAKLIYSDSWDYNGEKQPCPITEDFTTTSNLTTMLGKDNGYNRWQVSGAHKYEITYNAATAKLTVTPFIEKTLATAAEGYATFSSAYNVAIPSGITAQYATSSSNGAIEWSNLTTGIPANTGVLLSGNAGDTYKFTPTASTDNVSGNKLVAIPSATQLAQTADGNTNYILSKKNNLVAFYKVNSAGSYVAAGTAYLQVASGSGLAPAFISLDGETTAIDAIDLDEQTSKEANATIFDLSGRKVNANNLPKGIYVKNGKKFIIK